MKYRYDHKCGRKVFEHWLEKTCLKFISLSTGQWKRFEKVWSQQYESLYRQFLKLEEEFMALEPLKFNDKGHCRSLQIDKEARARWMREAMYKMRIPFDKSNHVFGSGHVKLKNLFNFHLNFT